MLHHWFHGEWERGRFGQPSADGAAFLFEMEHKRMSMEFTE